MLIFMCTQCLSRHPRSSEVRYLPTMSIVIIIIIVIILPAKSRSDVMFCLQSYGTRSFHDRINTQLIYRFELAQMVARRITKSQRFFFVRISLAALFYSFFYCLTCIRHIYKTSVTTQTTVNSEIHANSVKRHICDVKIRD